MVKSKRRKSEIMTYTGRRVNPLRLRIEDVYIQDIARALSNLCRFCGHVSWFYSVAQHSVLVSRFCEPEDALHGLLHDGSEAYLCDIPSPIKYHKTMAGYRKIEAETERTIYRAFGLKPTTPESVNLVDKEIRKSEAAALKHQDDELWGSRLESGELTISPGIIRRMLPVEAEELFLRRYLELTG